MGLNLSPSGYSYYVTYCKYLSLHILMPFLFYLCALVLELLCGICRDERIDHSADISVEE